MCATELRRAAAVLAALLLWAHAASAEQAAVTAEALFRAGREASRRGDLATACEMYRESYRLEAATGTLLNLAVCMAELGQLAEAWRRLQDVIHSLSRDDRRVALAERYLRELEPRLPRLTIVPAGSAPADLRVSLDGIELGAAGLGVALPLDPGRHAVEASAQGRAPRTYELDVAEGDRTVLEVEPGAELPAESAPAPVPARNGGTVTAPEPAARPATSRPPPVARSAGGAHAADAAPETRELVAYGLLGVGAASLIASAAASALVLDRLVTARDHCPDKRCDAQGLSAVESGDAFYTAALASLGLAVVASATAVYLLLREPQAEHRSSLRLTLAVAPGSVGGAVRTSF